MATSERMGDGGPAFPDSLQSIFDVDNPGARTPAVASALREMGADRLHASVVHGADPAAVERELLLSFDRLKHGAYTREWPEPSIFGWIADRYRIARYRLFRARKAEQEIDAMLAARSQP